MAGLKRLLKSTRLTPLGGALLAVIIAGALVAGLASKSVQPIGFFVLVLASLVLLGGGLSGGSRRRRTAKGLAERRAEFRPRSRRAPDESTTVGNEDAWRRERERRRQSGRGD